MQADKAVSSDVTTIRVKKMRQNNTLERHSDSAGTEKVPRSLAWLL
jgi:hypothetical protein